MVFLISLYIKFSFTAFKEPIRKEIQKLAASDYTNQNLVGGFQTAQDILDYHCDSNHGKMHPKFVADPNKKDGKGFYLLDKWPEKIGTHDDKKKGKLKSYSNLSIIFHFIECSKLDGIRYFHLFHFTEDKEKVNACLSPAIMMNNQMYKWKKVKIPKFGPKSVPATASLPQASRRKVATKRKLPIN